MEVGLNEQNYLGWGWSMCKDSRLGRVVVAGRLLWSGVAGEDLVIEKGVVVEYQPRHGQFGIVDRNLAG